LFVLTFILFSWSFPASYFDVLYYKCYFYCPRRGQRFVIHLQIISLQFTAFITFFMRMYLGIYIYSPSYILRDVVVLKELLFRNLHALLLESYFINIIFLILSFIKITKRNTKILLKNVKTQYLLYTVHTMYIKCKLYI